MIHSRRSTEDRASRIEVQVTSNLGLLSVRPVVKVRRDISFSKDIRTSESTPLRFFFGLLSSALPPRRGDLRVPADESIEYAVNISLNTQTPLNQLKYK
jgi:hypothetical protein